MQERRHRPGDVLDDYCPRERRITDHAIVAMTDGEIRRTRCGICDAEHEYKEGRVPAPRRKTQPPGLFTQVLDGLTGTPKPQAAPPSGTEPDYTSPIDSDVPVPMMAAALPADEPVAESLGEPAPATPDGPEEGGFRRSLIRATFPRPEGQAPPPRAIPEFTLQSLQNRRNNNPRNNRGRRRPGGGGSQDNLGPMRFRDQGHGQGQGQGQGQPNGGRRRRGGKKNR